MYTYIYIYIFIFLSLSLYIYLYIHRPVGLVAVARRGGARRRPSGRGGDLRRLGDQGFRQKTFGIST